MSGAIAARGFQLTDFGTAALRGAALLWFAVAVIGQWAFVSYIVAFYGPTLAGDFAAWDRNEMLIDGYVAGDAAGNLFFAAHVALAAVLTLGGAVQLVPQIRARAIGIHRWNGRLFLLAALAAALGGLYLVWVRGTSDGILGAISITLNAALIFTFAGLAWRAVRRKDIAAHQRWAMRCYLVTNGVWFLRVGVMAWATATQGASMQGFFAVWGFGCYLLPLLVYEAYLHAKRGAGPLGKLAAAGGLFALTGLMGVGIFGAYMGMWLPLL
jgi:Predicted membrane protein (DUF2306)